MGKEVRNVCLVAGCNNKSKVRGLCENCFATARVAIATGQKTDAELVSCGLMLPMQKRGPKKKNPMSAALAAIPSKRTK